MIHICVAPQLYVLFYIVWGGVLLFALYYTAFPTLIHLTRSGDGERVWADLADRGLAWGWVYPVDRSHLRGRQRWVALRGHRVVLRKVPGAFAWIQTTVRWIGS